MPRTRAGPRRPVAVAVIAACDEVATIADTVRAVTGVVGVGGVTVVDDGSGDGTADAASAAGARVIRTVRRLGKGGALEGVLDRIPAADIYLLVDGDIGASAAGVQPLLDAVSTGGADLALGMLPTPVGGGFGLVKRATARAVRRLSGFAPQAPLSGQRAITHACLWACRPLAGGFGVETAMLADAARMGFSISEVPVRLEHAGTGRSMAGFRHRAGQGLDIAAAVAPRLLGVR